jgi:hypothetical protein
MAQTTDYQNPTRRQPLLCGSFSRRAGSAESALNGSPAPAKHCPMAGIGSYGKMLALTNSSPNNAVLAHTFGNQAALFQWVRSGICESPGLLFYLVRQSFKLTTIRLGDIASAWVASSNLSLVQADLEPVVDTILTEANLPRPFLTTMSLAGSSGTESYVRPFLRVGLTVNMERVSFRTFTSLSWHPLSANEAITKTATNAPR